MGNYRCLQKKACEIAIKTLTEGNDIWISISSIRIQCQSLSGRSRKNLQELAELLYTSAYTLKINPKLYEDFCRDPHWDDKNSRQKPNPAYPDQALYFLLKVLMSANNKNAQKQRSLYFRALKKLFDENVLSTSIIALWNKHHGLQGLAKHNAAANKPLKFDLETHNNKKQQDFDTEEKDESEDNENLDFHLGENSIEVESDALDNPNGQPPDINDPIFDNVETNKALVQNHTSIEAIIKLKENDLKQLGSGFENVYVTLQIKYFNDSSVPSVDIIGIDIEEAPLIF